MNIEQIKYIIEVNNAGTITKAAEILHISSSALSQSIKQVENELNVKIFIRTRKGMIPTVYGKTIIQKFQEILKTYRELHQDLILQKEVLNRTIKVACAPAMTYVATKASLLVKKSFDRVNIVIEEMDPEKIINNIKKGDIDIGISPFLENNQNEDSIIYEHLYRGYVCIGVSTQSHLYKKKSVTPIDLSDETMVLYNSKPIKSFINKHLRNTQILLFSNNSDIIRTSILDGQTFTLCHNFTFKNHPDIINKKLAIIPLKIDSNFFYQDFGVFISATKESSDVSKHFQNTLSLLLNE